MKESSKAGSHKNIWQGLGRKRIEIPRSILKTRILNNKILQPLYIASLGYYPHAEGHYTYRKKGLPENFIFYCVDGYGWFKIGDHKYKVGPNEFFILPQNVEHAYGSETKDPWTIYWMHFGGNSLPALNTMPVIKQHFRPLHIKYNDSLILLFSKIYSSLELGFSTDNLLFSNMCLSHYLSLFIFNDKHFGVKDSNKEDIVDDAILFMQQHLDETINLQDLCDHVHYSPSRFSNLFRSKTGYAPIDYFIQMKMQKASQLLDFTDHPIKNVASAIGIDDPYYFSRRFTKTFGMSPTKYRSIKKD
jgi:AraC family transcriptional regulator, arabinose operon regulatory protein